MAFYRSFTTVSGFTFISRILGYVRELLIAMFIGAGPLSDVFFLALKLPNLFRRLFAEGAFNVAFVPIFSELYHHSYEKAVQFVQHAFSYLVSIVFLLVIFFEIFMPWLMMLIAPGFMESTGKFELSILYARITFPYIFFISLTAFMSGILNTLDRFAASTAAPILLNTNAIVALLLFSATPALASEALTWSVPISGICQAFWVYLACQRQAFHIRWVRPRLSPEVRKLFRKMIPGILGAGVYQFNLLVSDIIASFIPSGISYLSFSDRINQLPLSIIGATMGTVMLPLLTKIFRSKDKNAGLTAQNQALMVSFYLSLPAAVALFILAHPVISLLYQHGRFTPEAAQATAACLGAFVIGLPAYVMVKVLSNNFFARGNTKTPVYVACGTILLNIVLNIIFSQMWSYVGIAVATSIAYWANIFTLFLLLKHEKYFIITKELVVTFIKIIINCTIMGGCLYFLKIYFFVELKMLPWVGLLVMIPTGLIIYLGGSHLLKTINYKALKQLK